MKNFIVAILLIGLFSSCGSSSSLAKRIDRQPISSKCEGIWTISQADVVSKDSTALDLRKGIGIFDALLYKLAKIDGSTTVSEEDLLKTYREKTSSYNNLSTPAQVRTAWNANAQAYCRRIITLNELKDSKNVSATIRNEAATRLLDADSIYNKFISIMNSEAKGSYESVLKKKG